MSSAKSSALVTSCLAGLGVLNVFKQRKEAIRIKAIPSTLWKQATCFGITASQKPMKRQLMHQDCLLAPLFLWFCLRLSVAKESTKMRLLGARVYVALLCLLAPPLFFVEGAKERRQPTVGNQKRNTLTNGNAHSGFRRPVQLRCVFALGGCNSLPFRVLGFLPFLGFGKYAPGMPDCESCNPAAEVTNAHRPLSHRKVPVGLFCRVLERTA